MLTLSFYLRHSLAHLLRERQRTLFVLFCIAAGVAAIVALRTLGLMAGAALRTDIQAAHRGDLVIRMPAAIDPSGKVQNADGSEVAVDPGLYVVEGENLSAQTIVLSPTGVDRLEGWAAARGFELTRVWVNSGPFMRIYRVDGGGRVAFARITCVEPERFPLYGRVRIVAPAGASLAQALAGPRAIAASSTLVEELGAGVDTEVYLQGSPDPFTIKAIVDAGSEVTLADPFSAVYPFIYAPLQTAVDVFGQKANVYYVRMPAGGDVVEARRSLERELPGLAITTTEDLRAINAGFSDVLTRLVTVMGLVSLLIGGIGIANTMLVAVSRRSLEIAVLKTIGAQGTQVVTLFLVEAVLLGFVGSALGLAFGLGLVFVMRGLVERFIAQTLAFAVYPEALGIGLALGVTVTLAFALLPVLAAARVRPNAVLRPDAAAPRGAAGISLLVVLALAGVFGLVAGQILGDLGTGLMAAYAGALLLGLVTLVLRALVWGVARAPAFSNITVMLAQRAMDGQKGRVASTLLASVVGVFTLSVMVLLAQGTLVVIGDNTAEMIGGNVMLVVASLDVGRAVEAKVPSVPGVESWAHDTVYVAEVVAINGDRDMAARVERARQAAQRTASASDAGEQIDAFVHEFDMKVLEDDTWSYGIARGTDITADSQGRMVLEPWLYQYAFDWFELKPGDTLAFRFPGGAERTATIAGFATQRRVGVLNNLLVYIRATHGIVPPGFVPPEESPVPSVYVFRVRPDKMNETMSALAEVHGTFAVDMDEITMYTRRLVDQFVPLPVMVAALALFASSVIMANSVALATLERRRQIGIMKALGLQTEHVLGLLLLENGLVGLLGGLLGAGLGALVILQFDLTGAAPGQLPWGVLVLLILLALGLALAATLLAAWGPSRERPLNVLRYE